MQGNVSLFSVVCNDIKGSLIEFMCRAKYFYFEYVLGMTRVLKLDMPQKHWSLASVALGGPSPPELVHGYPALLSHLRVLASSVSSRTPPEERIGKLLDKALSGKYVEHAEDRSSCLNLDAATHHIFQQGQVQVPECPQATAAGMAYLLPAILNDASFIDHFVNS